MGYKTGFNLMLVHFYIRRKLDIYDAIHFSVWLKIGSNPPNINRFRSDTGKYFLRYLFMSFNIRLDCCIRVRGFVINMFISQKKYSPNLE